MEVFDTGRNWSMIVGASIGALNAGALAQFSPEAQCSQVQTQAVQFGVCFKFYFKQAEVEYIYIYMYHWISNDTRI